jgi:hypothetical protein
MRAEERPGGSYGSEGTGMQRSRGADSTSAQPRSPEKVRVVLCEDHNLFHEGVAEMDELVGADGGAAVPGVP